MKQLIIFLFFAFTLVACGNSTDDGPVGSYKGSGYRGLEQIVLDFDSDGNVECHVGESDGLASWGDEAYGTYTVDQSTINITFTAVDDDNVVYKSLPLELFDSLRYYKSSDTIVMYKDGASSTMKHHVTSVGDWLAFIGYIFAILFPLAIPLAALAMTIYHLNKK